MMPVSLIIVNCPCRGDTYTHPINSHFIIEMTVLKYFISAVFNTLQRVQINACVKTIRGNTRR